MKNGNFQTPIKWTKRLRGTLYYIFHFNMGLNCPTKVQNKFSIFFPNTPLRDHCALKNPIFPITRKPGKKKLFFGVRYKTKSGSINNFFKVTFQNYKKKIPNTVVLYRAQVGGRPCGSEMAPFGIITFPKTFL